MVRTQPGSIAGVSHGIRRLPTNAECPQANRVSGKVQRRWAARISRQRRLNTAFKPGLPRTHWQTGYSSRRYCSSVAIDSFAGRCWSSAFSGSVSTTPYPTVAWVPNQKKFGVYCGREADSRRRSLTENSCARKITVELSSRYSWRNVR